MTDKQISEMTFEEALGELEGIVQALESGDTPLEESITLYERGHRLRLRCQEALSAAEEKVEKLTLDTQGRPTGTVPYSEDSHV